jgi:hypothetical protein
MAEQDADRDRDPSEPDPAAASAAEVVRTQLFLVSASQLRDPGLRQQPVGGYRRTDVDSLLKRAARTIEDLGGKVKAAQGKIAELTFAQAEVEARPRPTAEPSRSPEEIVGEVLVTAQRAADAVREAAQLVAEQMDSEAQQIRAEAERRREEADQLHREAQATAEDALEQAIALRIEALAEGERLIGNAVAEAERLIKDAVAEAERLTSDAVAEAAQVRADLEAEADRSDAAIADLRGKWAGFVSDALTRLEGIEFELGSAATEDLGATSKRERPAPAEEPQDDAKDDPRQDDTPEGDTPQEDVVSELSTRLPSGAGDANRA